MFALLRSSFKIALISLLSSKVRSFLTMLGIIIGVSSVILLVSIGSGLKEFIGDQFEGLGTNLLIVLPGKIDVKTGRGRVPGTGLPASKFILDDVRALVRDSSFIKAVVPIINTNTTAKLAAAEVRTTATGTTSNYRTVRNNVLADGSFISSEDETGSRKVAVLGATVVKNLYGEGGRPILGQSILVGNDHFRVVGYLEKHGASFGGADVDDQIFIPITTAQVKFGVSNPSLLYVEASSRDNLDLAMADVSRILKRRIKEDDFTVLNQADLLSTINSILNVLTTALAGIAGISLLVGGIGIMNIMLVSVTERTREIGLRKAVGASFNDILWQFLIEAVVVSCLGGFVGIVLGFAGALGVGFFISTQVPIWSVVLAFSFSALVGIIFGLLPAIKAAKLDPVEALRYE